MSLPPSISPRSSPAWYYSISIAVALALLQCSSLFCFHFCRHATRSPACCLQFRLLLLLPFSSPCCFQFQCFQFLLPAKSPHAVHSSACSCCSKPGWTLMNCNPQLIKLHDTAQLCLSLERRAAREKCSQLIYSGNALR